MTKNTEKSKLTKMCELVPWEELVKKRREREKRNHFSVLSAIKGLLKVSPDDLWRYEGARVARVTVVIADIPGKKNAKEIHYSTYLPAYIDREGNVSCKEEEDNA